MTGSMSGYGGRSSRVKRNVVSKTLVRQLVGDRKLYRLFGVEPSSRPFHKLPSRLCFRLSSLVDENRLRAEGHVFLGFLKDGNFVVSYTHLVGSEEEIGGGVGNSYYLHWWLFVPYRKLEKVGSVRLFGDEVINSDDILSLTVSQWPRDQTKLVVCGTETSGYMRSTFITIVFNPLLSCSYSRSSRGVGKCCSRCCTALHYVNCHLPVYPLFVPFISMKLDGVCIINGGDSLIALAINSVHVSDSPSRLEVPLAADWSSGRCASDSSLPGCVRLVESEYNLLDDPASDRRALTYGLGLLGAASPRVFAANFSGRPLHLRRGGGVSCKLFMLNVESYFISELGDTDEHSFVDFDMIILDVCEASYNVIVQVNVLYRLKVPVARTSFKQGERLQRDYKPADFVKRSIKFAWSLATGTVTRLGVSDFSDASDKHKSWSCQPEELLQLQRRFGMPPTTSLHTVACMSNKPVLNGESLKLLVDPNNYVTIVL